MQPFTRLSDDPATGHPTIDGVPATPEQVRKILHEDGEWDSGEFIVRAGDDDASAKGGE